MKYHVLRLSVIAIGLLAACHPVICADVQHASGTPKVELRMENELRVLAEGYQAAVAEFPSGAKYVWIRNGDKVMVLGSVSAIKAYGGVLLIRTESGPTHVVNAGDILQITNEKPKAVPRE